MKKNTKFYIMLSILFIFSLNIPYLLAYFCTPKDMVFSGLVDGILDDISYFAKINNGKYFNSLEFLMRSSIHTEDLSGGFIFTLYSFFGLIFKQLPTVWIYHILRLSSSLFFIISLYFFLKEFVKEENRIFTSFLIMFSTGCLSIVIYLFMLYGGNIVRVNHMPRDIFPFISNMYVPHFTVAISLIMLSLITVNKYDTNKIKYSIINGIVLFLIATIHPQVAVFIGLSEGIYLLTEIKKKSYKIKDLLPIALWGLIPLPYLIYLLNIFNSKYVLMLWNSKNIHPIDIKSIFVIYIPSMLLLIYVWYKNKVILKENKLLTILLLCYCSILLLPKNMQVKLTEGVSIPALVILSVFVASTKYKVIIQKLITFFTIFCLIPYLFSPIIPNVVDTLTYFPKYYEEMYEDINKTEYPSIFFSNLYTSSFVFANTKQILHSVIIEETEDFDKYNTMYENAISTKDHSFLNDINTNYYIYDKYVAGLNDTIEVESNLPYEKYKETENYIIYKIKERINEKD